MKAKSSKELLLECLRGQSASYLESMQEIEVAMSNKYYIRKFNLVPIFEAAQQSVHPSNVRDLPGKSGGASRMAGHCVCAFLGVGSDFNSFPFPGLFLPQPYPARTMRGQAVGHH
jgi:hypothetical protein